MRAMSSKTRVAHMFGRFAGRMDGNQLHVLWHEALLWGTQLGSCAMLAWIIAQGIWWLAAPGRGTFPGNASAPLSSQGDLVTARHFFDTYVAKNSPGAAEMAPTTGAMDSRWRLLGTYVSVAGDSRALLTLDGSGQVLIVQIGDKLPSGHTVEAVLPERIVLSQESQQSEITLRPNFPERRGQETSGNRSGIPVGMQAVESISASKDPR